MTERSSNERDFYRVECRAIVGLVPLPGQIPAGRTADSYFGEADQFDLLRELRRLEQESTGVLHQIGETDRALGGYLHVINRKIDALARHLAMLSPELRNGEEQTVSISEAAIAFAAAGVPEIGSVVAIRVMMLPSGTAFAAFGKIMKHDRRADGATVGVTVHFDSLPEAERQLIARHVMQVQMAEQRRRAGRE